MTKRSLVCVGLLLFGACGDRPLNSDGGSGGGGGTTSTGGTGPGGTTGAGGTTGPGGTTGTGGMTGTTGTGGMTGNGGTTGTGGTMSTGGTTGMAGTTGASGTTGTGKGGTTGGAGTTGMGGAGGKGGAAGESKGGTTGTGATTGAAGAGGKGGTTGTGATTGAGGVAGTGAGGATTGRGGTSGTGGVAGAGATTGTGGTSISCGSGSSIPPGVDGGVSCSSSSPLSRMPKALFNLAAVTAPDGRIFLAGGATPSDINTPTSLPFSVYDPATGTHQVLTPVPGATGGQPAAAFAKRKLILVDGGAWKYDLDTNCWTSVPVPMTLINRGAATGSDGRAYFFGGEVWPAGYATDAVHAYDPTNDQWETRPSMPFTGYAMGATEVDGRIYLVGAWTASFDLATGAWTILAGAATQRVWLLGAGVDPGGRVVMLGGYEFSGNGQIPGTEIYDPKTDRWTTGVPPPLRVMQMGVATSCGGAIFTFGGSSVVGTVDRVQVYDAVTDRWRISQ